MTTRARHRVALGAGLVVATAALAFIALLSIAYGSKSIPLGRVIDSFTNYDRTVNDHLIVTSSPRAGRAT